MANERQTSLGDVAELIRGVSFRPTDLLGSGRDAVPLLRATNIGYRTLDFADVLHVPSSLVREAQYLRRFDIVIALSSGSRRAVGRLAQLRCDWVGCVGAFCGVIRPDPRGVDPEYLGYVTQSSEFRARIETYAVGTAIMNLSREHLLGFSLRLPNPATQRGIANVLGSLDDKIELNRRTSATLEAVGRALFKSWFVDFDPVRAKAAGRDPGLPAPLADLFPDSFEDSELGEVPQGWRVQPFSETIEIIGGGTPKTSVAEYWNGDIPWFSVVDAPSGSDVWVMNTEKKITAEGVEKSSTRVLPMGATIISARGTVGRVALVGVPMAMNQSCYGIVDRAGSHGFFTYFATRELVVSLQQHAHGSVFDTITRDTLAGVSVALPPAALIEAFEEIVRATLERLRCALVQSRTLISLRDTLLPKLISGELRVIDVERSAGSMQ